MARTACGTPTHSTELDSGIQQIRTRCFLAYSPSPAWRRLAASCAAPALDRLLARRQITATPPQANTSRYDRAARTLHRVVAPRGRVLGSLDGRVEGISPFQMMPTVGRSVTARSRHGSYFSCYRLSTGGPKPVDLS
jgi:hypothetical protein